jgi:uncharacterized protein
MIKLGEYNVLKAIRRTDNGFYLADTEGVEVLLPNAYVSEELKEEDEIGVFVYKDSEDRPVATTLYPKIMLGEFACLKVINVNNIGAFMDWGLPKDLLCPFAEQRTEMLEGRSYIVYLLLDEKSDRLIATAKVNAHFETENIELEVGQEVDLLIAGKSDMGYKCVINQKYVGLIFANETFQKMRLGLETKGYVKNIREDKKIDISLQQESYKNIEPNSLFILEFLKENDGFSNITDKTDPIVIKEIFQMSKKSFKKAIGTLYKQKLIRIEEDGIYLVK